jgi:hypothetical protein
MLKRLWTTWTIDQPAAFGDWLWDVFVVQFAAWLDRLTMRQVIAVISVFILILAYSHGIPLPPELMLVGDALAYLDLVSVLVLLGMISRATTILFVIKQITTRAMGLLMTLRAGHRRSDARHRRARAAARRKPLIGRSEDDGYPGLIGFACA